MRSAITIAVALLLASCGGEAKLVGPAGSQPATTSPTTPSPVATPATPIVATATAGPVGAVIWTTAVDPRTSAPADSVTRYAPEVRRIIAAVPLRGLPAGSTLTASWFYNDTSLDAFSTHVTVTVEADQTWVSFYIERNEETLWPEGVYEIAIALGGREVQRAAVEMVATE